MTDRFSLYDLRISLYDRTHNRVGNSLLSKLPLLNEYPFSMPKKERPIWGKVSQSNRRTVTVAGFITKIEFNSPPCYNRFHLENKMGLRWWRDVLIRNQTKRYLDDR